MNLKGKNGNGEQAPDEIWAFYDPDLSEDNSGATIVAHESYRFGAWRYVRREMYDKIKQELDGVVEMIGDAK